METTASAHCTRPAVRRFIPGYCFEDLSCQELERLAAHLVECDACWDEVQRIEAAVSVLRQAGSEHATAISRDVQVLTGPSSQHHRWLGGHAVTWVICLVVYGLLHGLALFTEFAYSFDVLGVLGAGVAAGVAFGSTIAGIGLVHWCWRLECAGRKGAAHILAAGLVGIALAAAGAGAAVLPGRPLIEAAFQTYPAPLGYVKTLFWTLLPALVLMPLPFLFAIALQRELHNDRHRGVLMVLTRQALWVPPPGHLFVPPVVLGVVGAVFVVLDFAGMSHLFDALRPDGYVFLFMAARWSRFVLLVFLVTSCVVWYARALADLKREAVAGAATTFD